MSGNLPNLFLAEFTSKLIAAGLPEEQARRFAEECLGYRDLTGDYYELPGNRQMPSDDCFRTLAEAQKIFAALPDKDKYSGELDLVHKYLSVPYGEVEKAKKEIAGSFAVCDSEVEALFAQDSEWLLISADSVKAFAAFLRSQFSDPELIWSVYREAALLGQEITRERIEKVLTLLGREAGEQVIRSDLQRGAWLYYRWYSDPVGCIGYMLERGLAPGQILTILQQEPLLLYFFKEGRRRSYNHDQKYIDQTIQKYAD